jgi:toxin ParE1/3/4
MDKPEHRLIWSDDAEQDLLSIWRYGADEWSPTAADDHLHDIEATCRMLQDVPELGKSRSELVRGARSILVDPHIIFYRISAQAIEVLRVLHQREDISGGVFHSH